MGIRKIDAPICVLALAILVTAGLAGPAQAAVPDHLPVASVSASSSDGNVAENAVDDDPATRWSAQTTDQAEPQWLAVDLGSVRAVGYLGIAWHSGDKRRSSYGLQVSADGSQWTTVVDRATSSGTTADLEPVTLGAAPETGRSARYLRYLGYGNSVNGWNSILELRVYPPNPDGAVVGDLSDLLPKPDPDAVPWTGPGLVDLAGGAVTVPTPAPATGRQLDVIDYGADPAAESADDAAAIRSALADAEPGDTVVLPAGTYDLITTEPGDPTTNVGLRTGVRLVGAGREATILRSHLTRDTNSGKVLRGYGVSDVVITGLMISSTYDGPLSTDPEDDEAGGGPTYGIVLANQGMRVSERVMIDNVAVERFERMGVRLEKTRFVVVRNSAFRDATGVGGGGTGYGVSIQGTPGADRYAWADDSRFNVVTGNTFEGTHLRHAILLQYFTHNNLVADNLITGGVLDAIDLHGEGEYLNEIRGNRVTDNERAAIGVGNTGGSASQHGASGRGNWIHRNHLRDNQHGIMIILGSPDTLVEHNLITGGETRARAGIELRNAPGTIVRGNRISGNQHEGFWGIRLVTDPGDSDGDGAGDPRNVLIKSNSVTGNFGGVRIDAGQKIVLQANRIVGNRTNLVIGPEADVVVR